MYHIVSMKWHSYRALYMVELPLHSPGGRCMMMRAFHAKISSQNDVDGE